MNQQHMSLPCYLAIAANACTAFAMSGYLLVTGWLSLTVVVSVITIAAYIQGYRYASLGKEVPKRPYMFILAIYTGLFALPPMARMKAAIFAYELARLLMFRAVWLRERSEAYLHLLLYFSVVATCFGHWRADWTLLPLLLPYAVTLIIALTVLHQDSLPKKRRSIFPWSTVLASVPLVTALTLVLFLITPLLPGPGIQLIPDMPAMGNGAAADGAGGLSGLLAGMAQQPAKANPQSPWLSDVLEALRNLSQVAHQAESAMQLLARMLAPSVLIALLLALGHALWRKRQRAYLWWRVKKLDPWLLRRLAHQHPVPATAPQQLHAAYDRLWAYNGIRRSADQTPMEHLHAILKEYALLGSPSMQLVRYFHEWRYGSGSTAGFAKATECYERIRLVLEQLESVPERRAHDGSPR